MFVELISNPHFTNFISTFGLAVVIVLYFVFVRDPKQAKYWQGKYDELSGSYQTLSETYKELNSSLRPESRKISNEQATMLCNVALDRDLYKLYFHACKKVDGTASEDVNLFLQDSIIDTTGTWVKFTSPFPQVPCISDLYGVYKNNGAELRNELQEILDSPETVDDKKQRLWNKLCENTLNMKREFAEHLRKLAEGKAVEPVKESGQAV